MQDSDIRNSFPILRSHTGKPLIYFDNACQSLRPLPVIEAINRYYTEYPACGGRSMHSLGKRVDEEVDKAREKIAQFIGAKKKEEIVFTRNTTEGINLVANSLGLTGGDIVITSDKEHNSNLIPWQILRKIGIIHKIIPSRADNTFDLTAFKASLDKNVKLISICYTSNLDGVTNPIPEIIELAHAYDIPVLVDAAQAAPHQKIKVQDVLDVDFLAFSGHKVLGPSGTGVLYGKYKLLEKLSPFLVGGDTVASTTYETAEFLPPPEKFEAGLQDYAGIVGLGEAVRFIEKIGFDRITKQEQLLNSYLTEELKSLPGIHIIGPKEAEKRGGILSFYVDGVDSHQIALMLSSSAQIMVRSGQFCVHSWFNAHKIAGAVRISLAFYNTIEEAEYFVAELKKILSVLE